ncbi:energy-coupling factor transporter transmembrane component T [Paenibacillus sp. NPDC058174]|uniref:energy-coupling factor transporter transmembrane component T n=1 Tax=Paenibacillus sp. NPDC058174 TaxID=3346366 RepID=UPI0036DD50BA
MMKDSFSSFHPIINFGYFAAMLLFGMFLMHPVLQVIALLCALTYSNLLNGRRAVKFNLLYMLPLFIIMAVMNPVFNHAGVTILFYLKNGNPMTLESILYGISAACMFVTILLWFSCYNAVMTSDKFIYLFGKIMPALSLIFSMVLRFVPRYKEQIKRISLAQRSIGRDITQGNMLVRARNGLTILSIMTTWALENAIETADSMKSRGYGLPGRTSFSLYRFDSRDRLAGGALLVLIAIMVIGEVSGRNDMRFFPSVKMAHTTPFSIIVFIAYLLLGLLPVIIHVVEALKWKSISSKT